MISTRFSGLQSAAFAAIARKHAPAAIKNGRGPQGDHRDGFNRKPFAVLEVVRHRHHVGLLVVERDGHAVGGKYLGDLVADQVDDRLEVQLRRQPLLHAVDDCELRCALLAFNRMA